MKTQIVSVKETTKYTIFLIILIYVICPNDSWNYSKCLNYLNSFDITCNQIKKNDIGMDTCLVFEFPKNINLPLECNNQKYNLNVYIKGSNPPIKRWLEIYINLENIFVTLKKCEKYYPLVNKKIQECFLNLMMFKKKCLSDKYFRNENECQKLEKNKSEFCKGMDDITKEFEDQLDSIKLGDIDFGDIELGDIELGDLEINNIKDSISLTNEYDDNIVQNFIDEKTDINANKYFNFQEKEAIKSYFPVGNNNNEYQNELEEYYINSRKDCVEYGLKSLEENIIICTKYE